jgi:alkanesulfonate monooxygenase SsuD/methylene tetrahydromethanopterin reductase-like flavin-dependent oxidoreductase (luciferase family)
MLPVVAQYADQWNAWTTPEQLAHKVSVLRAYCEQIGRDPAEIHVSTQALLFLSNDEHWVMDNRKTRPPEDPVIAGNPGEVTEIIGRFRDAGADEIIVPDHTLGSLACKKDTCDLFITEVAPAFR